MRILICHNNYQQHGGEDAVVLAEYQLLQQHSHCVEQYIVSNEQIHSTASKIFAALNICYSKKAKRQLKEKLLSFMPDVVHFHNTFPLLSPSVYDACRELSIPVVQTLHNYRFICPTALLMLNGKPCETSLENSAYWAISHKVYRNSLMGTFLLARMIEHHKRKKTWATRVDRYITLSHFAKNKFIAAEFPESKISIKPNFTTLSNSTSHDSVKQPYAIFVGRLSEEKGVHTLIKAFHNNKIPLKIIGEGPLQSLSDTSASNIDFLGRKSGEELAKLIAEARFLVMPSECYETFGMVIIEAFACKTAVLCSEHGSMKELVSSGHNGLHFSPGNHQDLSEKALKLYNNIEFCKSMGENAYQCYLDQYTAEKNYQQLINIYQDAIDAKKDTTA